MTGEQRDADRARSCIDSRDSDRPAQFARLAAISGNPKDLEEAKRSYEFADYQKAESLLAIAAASRDLADLKGAFYLITQPLHVSRIISSKDIEQVLVLTRLMAEKLEEISKITVKLPAQV